MTKVLEAMHFAKKFVHIFVAGLLGMLLASTALAQDVASDQAVTAEAFRAINVRSGPSTDYEIIGQLYEGTVVTVIGRSDPESNWLLVDHNGEVGWVAFFTVTITGDPTTVDIVGSANVNTIGETALPAPTPLVERPESELYVTAYRRVNVRSGPGTEFSVVAVLAPGETADIIGTSGEDNEWLEISKDGWIAYFVVNVSGDLSALEPSESSSTEQVLPPFTAQAAAPALDRNQVLLITRFNTNLRAEPRFNAPIVTVIPYETTLEATARTADSNWLRVAYNGATGWLIASLVNTGVSDISSLPVEPLLPESTPTQ